MPSAKDWEIARLKADNVRLRSAIEQYLRGLQIPINDTFCARVESWVELIEAMPPAGSISV